ncbi:Tfp pilus assembly protein FimT/FimU [Schlesneria sp. DSM 10557]|uniref:pilus assembly FimT family protein n=1 Tax=Schlesneria sp. DSM 10557 TaxID=3044399 RepID=UPI0035A1297B
MLRHTQQTPNHNQGFTLVELLIVMSLMITLLAIAAATIKVNMDADRVRGAARSIQSYLLGARDRAIYAKQPRGVRLILNPTNPRTVSSMIHIQPTEPWNGQVQLLPRDPMQPWNSLSNPMVRVRLRFPATLPNWQQLNQRNLLTSNAHPRIKIPATNLGVWYVIDTLDLNGANQDILLTTPYRNPNPTGINNEPAQIELPPSPVPNEEPMQLPRGVVIDLDACSTHRTDSPGNKLPNVWKNFNSSPFAYKKQLDIMFSPRGSITGTAAASGIIHLYVTEMTAADLQLDAAYSGSDPAVPDKNVVTIFSRTGNVITSPVNSTDVINNQDGSNSPDGIADDPFFYPERGEIAGR